MNSNLKNDSISLKRKKFTGQKDQLWLWGLCLIPMLLLLIFNYIPMFGLIIAFKDYRFNKGIFGSEWVGLKNFEFFFKSDDFFRIVRNTLVLNGVFIIVGLIFAVGIALILYEINSKKAIKIYQTSIIIPHYLSWVIVAYISYTLLNPQYGIINQILVSLGMEKISWYEEAGYWPVILTIANTWKHMGMNSVIYFATLVGIDNTYFEAAAIDGASRWQIIKNIKLPFLIPIMSIMTILNIGNIFRADFGLFYQLPRDVGALYPTTDVVDTYIYRVMRSVGDMSMSAAVGFLQSVVGLILILVTNYVAGKIDDQNALL